MHRSQRRPRPAPDQHGSTTSSEGPPRRGGPSLRLALLVALLVLAASCSGSGAPRIASGIGPSDPALAPDPGGAVRAFELTAAPLELQLKPGLREHAWAYNGQVPGPVLRVRAGDLVRVTLRNRLPVGTTIHWHGIAVPYGQDGVAGLTQEAIPPGGDATYSFVPRVAGTYWYHSHERGSEQVDRGLYGALVVDPPTGAVEADAVLVLDEWPLGLSMATVPPRGDFNLASYTTFSVNGRAGTAIAPVTVRPGPFRLRLVNAGYEVHLVHLDGVEPAIVALDGHELTGGPPTADSIPIAPGERVDLRWTAAGVPSALRLEDGQPPAEETVVPLVPAGEQAPARGAGPITARHPVLDLFTYPASAKAVWPAGAVASKSFQLELGERPAPAAAMKGMGASGGLVYTINGEAFPATPDFDVAEGDLVRLTIVNRTRVEHSIHLHGHFFQLLSHNGRPPAGTLLRDTMLVLPGDTVEVGFRADNPGWWMVHCHQLYHSMAGMMAIVRYSGTARKAELGGRLDSVPD